jgi:alkylation response protein AidB-like acyl-CoA dehydrogenase
VNGPLETAEARRWRRELRDWLEEHAPRDLPGPEVLGSAEQHRAWERTLCDAGYAAIHWPSEYGGRDADVAAQMVFQEEYDRVRAPVRVNVQALFLAGPVLMRYGTREQQDRWLAPMLRCDEIWCQGFSEPGAGSDLASLRTRGRIDGDELVIDGQKIWTSYAAWSDWIFALVRTDPEARKHAGITWVMVDLTTPGVEVRPLRQMNGGSDFCEVFFTDVRVPLTHVVGGVGNGWKVAMSTLSMERGPGRRSYVKYLHDLQTLRGFVDARGLGDDLAMCEELGDLLGSTLAYRCYVDRVVDEITATGDSESSGINKLLWSEMQAHMFDVGMSVLGDASELVDDQATPPGADEWRMEYWHSRAALIYAGTNQIQKNIIAERMLGLPRGGAR